MRVPITRRQFLHNSAAAAASLTALSLLKAATPARAAAATSTGPPKLLLEGLASDDLIIGADAARLLGDLGSKAAVGPLLDYVTNCPYYAKTAGLDALARIGDRSAVERIRGVFADPRVDSDVTWWYGSTAVRLGAGLALLTLGDDSPAEWLLDEDTSRDEVDRRNWAMFCWFAPAVLRLPDTLKATRRLKKRITVEKLTVDSNDVHRFVVRCDALALLGTDEATSALVGFTGHLSRYVRGRAAVRLLGVSDHRGHVDRVVSMAQNDRTDFARIKACEALGREGRSFYARRVAEMAARTPDPFDKAAAVESLGALGAADHLGVVIRSAGAEDPYLRLCAVEALDRIGTPAAIEAAGRRMDDPDMRVRMQAAKCIAAHRQGGAS